MNVVALILLCFIDIIIKPLKFFLLLFSTLFLSLPSENSPPPGLPPAMING